MLITFPDYEHKLLNITLFALISGNLLKKTRIINASRMLLYEPERCEIKLPVIAKPCFIPRCTRS